MAGYLGATPVPQATQHRESFTATSGQTTFATAGYTAGFVDVYLNGSHLSPADFVATNGSDVVLASGASADDVCDIISHSAFELNAQTFTGTTTMDVVTATGVVTANGGAVFNEGSADVDFRVESNGNANMLFVDGGTNDVGIGTASAGAITTASGRPGLVVGTGSGHNGVTIFSGAGSRSSLFFADATSGTGTYIGQIDYNHNTDTLKVETAGVEALTIDASGIVNMPKQPAFLVRKNADQNNLAVDTVDITFQTEIFDQNADFASNAFTAPVTGRYQLNAQIRLDNVDTAADYYQIKILTSNRELTNIFDPGVLASDAVFWTLNLSQLCDMDASDTAKVQIRQVSGSAQTDVGNNGSSWFSGYLVA